MGMEMEMDVPMMLLPAAATICCYLLLGSLGGGGLINLTIGGCML